MKNIINRIIPLSEYKEKREKRGKKKKWSTSFFFTNCQPRQHHLDQLFYSCIRRVYLYNCKRDIFESCSNTRCHRRITAGSCNRVKKS